MAIIVKTGGPVQDFSDMRVKPDTFNRLAETISDEIDDTTGEYNLQISQSIMEAIRYCERENYYFNESRRFLFNTVDEQEWYGDETPLVADEESPASTAGQTGWFSNLVRIPWVFCSYGPYPNNIKRKLQYVSPDELEYFSDKAAARGIPDSYTYFNKKLRLYPIPSGGPYQVRLTAVPVRLSEVVNPDERHPWFVEACDMIKARSKYNLYKNYLKDAAMAQEALNDFEDQRNQLRIETSMRINGSDSNLLTPTKF